MVKTLSSATQLLIPVAEFLNRVNPDLVAQLCSDDPANPVLTVSLTNDPILQSALLTASGMFESACLLGQRYEADDLLSLVYVFVNGLPTTTVLSSFPNAAGMMFDILADLGYYALWKRRPNRGAPLPPSLEMSKAMLEQLSLGARILGFTETEDAGHPTDHQLTAEDIRRQDLSTWIANRFYGTRADMDRRGGGWW